MKISFPKKKDTQFVLLGSGYDLCKISDQIIEKGFKNPIIVTHQKKLHNRDNRLLKKYGHHIDIFSYAKNMRLEIIEEAQIGLILDSSDKVTFNSAKTIAIKELKAVKMELFSKDTPSTSLAYILFTSGSTGKPKGVQITRNNVGVFMESFWDTGIQISQTDRCLQCFDLTFDVSVQSYLVPLTTGACAYTIPHDQIKYSYIYGLLEEYKLTFGAMAPSMIRYLRPYFDEIKITSMRYNILTAEASPVDLVTEWSKCIPNAEIFDFYGPTEATIYCTYQKFYRNRKNKQLNGK